MALIEEINKYNDLSVRVLRMYKLFLDKNNRRPWIVSGDIQRLMALALAVGLDTLPAAMCPRILWQLSHIVSKIWYVADPGTVNRIRHHLVTLFDDNKTEAMLNSWVLEQLAFSIWNTLILNLLPSLDDKNLSHLLKIDNLSYLNVLREQMSPVLLLGAHYGVYGYAVTAFLSARGYPTWLVGYSTLRNYPVQASRLYNWLYWPRVQRLEKRVKQVTVAPGEKSQPELIKILKEKTDIFYLLPDQYFIVNENQPLPAHLVSLRFLNRKVYLDISGIQPAKQMGARVFTAIPIANEQEQHITIEPMTWANPGTRAEDIGEDLQVYLSRLEQRLLENPALWRDLRRLDLVDRITSPKGDKVQCMNNSIIQ
ncbi:MAG: hypothetical protein JXA33_01845 [Anaerolineae bacterium]|nr:hypothetical protein [Anaerolineae bacterium]